MIHALITGRLVHCKAEEKVVVGRIVLADEKPVEFTARRGVIKAALLALPFGMPVSVSGSMTSAVGYSKAGEAHVHHEILVTAVMTAQPPRGLLASILSKAKP